MATDYVSQSERDDYRDHPVRRFKFRRFSREGKPVAQVLFDELRERGEPVRLVKWEQSEPREMERANM